MKKRVGILFSGQIRANSLNPKYNKNDIILNSISQYFLNSQFKEKYNYDVFISTDDIDVEKAKSYFGRNLKNINLTEKNWFHNPMKTTPQSFDYYNKKYVNKNFNGHDSHSHAIYQYYRMYINYLMLKNYQEDSNQTYDYFVRIRLDARIMQDLNVVFEYLEKTEKSIFIEHEQLMIVKPELVNVFKLIEHYGTYEEPVQNKYAIYLYLTDGRPLESDKVMKYSPEKQFVDHIYYTLLQNNKDYFKSLCDVTYPSFNLLYRENGSYAYVSHNSPIYRSPNDWKPIHNMEYIIEHMENDHTKNLTNYPILPRVTHADFVGVSPLQMQTCKKEKKYKVLFINHKIKKCGVYQYGIRLFDILQKSENIKWVFLEMDCYAEYLNKIHNTNYDLIFYNYHPMIMRWLNPFNIQRRVKNIGLQHDLVENDIFDVTLRLDCTLKEMPNRFNIQRPIFEDVDKLLENYTPISNEFAEFLDIGKDKNIPIFGSFGFGFKRKNFDHIVKYICDICDEAIIKFVMPNADTQSFDEEIIGECIQQLKKPNIKLLIYRNFVDELDIVKFLQTTTMNIFMYETHESAGVSSVIDYALSVKTPIAITKSSWFRHIYSEEIDVGVKDINHILKYSRAVCDKYREEFSNQNLIDTVDRHVINNIQ
jgi:hypothetical protein